MQVSLKLVHQQICSSVSTSLIIVELHPSIAWVDLEVVRGCRKEAAAPPLVFEYEFHLY